MKKSLLTPLILLSSCAALSGLSACQAAPTEPTLSTAERFSWNAAPRIQISGLTPDTAYTLRLTRRLSGNTEGRFVSTNEFVSDSRGRIDTSAQAATNSAAPDVYLPFQTMEYAEQNMVEVSEGFVELELLTADEELVAAKSVKFTETWDDFTETPLGADFPGAFILRAASTDEAQPLVVVLGGSEGGDGSARRKAPEIAAKGYAVLGLPYYSPAWFGNEAQIPELPRAFAELPVDYLESAVAAARQRPEIDPDHVALLGGSKGAEYVLLAGSLIPDDSPGGGFCGIVANVPSDVVWEGWGPDTEPGLTSGFSWRGDALPFVPYVDMNKALADNRGAENGFTMADAHQGGLEAFPERIEAARIKVENIDEPVMLFGGDKDTVWPSGPMSRRIEDRRDAAGLETQSFIYPEGSHRVGGHPFNPAAPADHLAVRETYPATFEFLAETLSREDCRTIDSE